MQYEDKKERKNNKVGRNGKGTMGYCPVNKYICERSLINARVNNNDHLKFSNTTVNLYVRIGHAIAFV